MEGLQNLIRSTSKDPKSDFTSSFSEIAHKLRGGGESGGISGGLSSADSSRVLITRPPRQMISIWTCSKLCAVCFVAGIFVGYTLKQRVRRWVSGLLKRLRDD